jgi:capsular exopolysaccharide synthesis family protein
MSRIHDALKKAELEKSVNSGEAGQAAAARLAEAVEVEPHPSPSVATMPSFAAPFTFEALQQRCAAGEWSPDPATMLFFHEEEAVGRESFRTLRSRLFQIREKFPMKKILVTASMGSEGKSFVAANLAQAMVQQRGQRALLIDADLRGPKLHSALGTSSTPGLSDYLMGDSEEFAIMQRGPMENLFFVPAGTVVANPLELIANGRMNLLLSRVEQFFDWIILNSPPAVQVSDAGQLANSCDGVLLVVRSNATPFDLAQRARDEFYGKKIVGVVLNGVDARSLSHPGYHQENFGHS